MATASASTRGTGPWTKEENARFLQALEVFPQGPWKAIADFVETRTIRQTQGHAQKHREKMARRASRFRRDETNQFKIPPKPIFVPCRPESDSDDDIAFLVHLYDDVESCINDK
ncbi:Aste57867_8321 [Aphanomyces stellatus]|uniref:Aste57867_8321 protein n=1 Tax=Aphanomyces stellatus TaxID=120398 RepID=A0A485KJX7_9STRA|nr:hypothetical protein As57867_008289 [Aphanomyces stellatus]VFT85208.1 Aste57867_8321 [Aphanomyces stellatus]